MTIKQKVNVCTVFLLCSAFGAMGRSAGTRAGLKGVDSVFVFESGLMKMTELLQSLLGEVQVGVLMTDAQITRPGPVISFANEAFATLSGRDVEEVVGLTPRFMQGRDTRRTTLDAYSRALQAGERFHGYLINYRKDGSRYNVEIDCRPLRGKGGAVENFVAFQREVTRRVGRPAGGGGASRFEAVLVSNEMLTPTLRRFGVFGETGG